MSQENDNDEEDTGDDERELSAEVEQANRDFVIEFHHAMNRLRGDG